MLFICFLLLSVVYNCLCVIHPGGWHTVEDIHRIREKVASKKEPWHKAYEALMKTGPDFNQKPRPAEYVLKTGGDYGSIAGEASNAYTLMIKWVATNDSRYGDAGIAIFDAWSEKLKEVGDDALRNRSYCDVHVGVYSSKFAQAAELAAYYKPNWAHKKRAQDMFMNLFYPVVKMGAAANWGTACMTAIMSIGIFADKQLLIDDAINAYKHGGFTLERPNDGCAGVGQYIDSTGQIAESGRDQAHTQGGIAHLLETAVSAYNQKVNIFHEYNNRLALGFEYTAKYNLGHDVPYHPFADPCNPGKFIYPNGISAIHRGDYSLIWEMAYNYFKLVGISAPYCKQVRDLEKYTPEGTQSDHPGFGTLTFYRD